MDNTLLLLYRLLRYLPDVCMHFWSSGLAALLAWGLTWTISSLLWRRTLRLAARRWSSWASSMVWRAGRFIGLLSWSAALFAALLVHVMQDFYCWLW